MNAVSRTARSVSFAAIVGLSTALAAPGIAAAEQISVLAQEAPAPAPTVGAGNIDFTKTGSITIHKRMGAEGATNNDGNALTDVPGENVSKDDIDDIKFKVTQVDADLTTNEGFAKALELTPKTAQPKTDGYSSELTSTNGDFVASNLPIGVYLVEEIVDPANTTIVAGSPFLVFVPTTNNDGDQTVTDGTGQQSNWNYDVHVYPKNSKVKVKKEVKDADQNVGDNITYSVTGQAPIFGAEQKLTKFIFEDQLDPRVAFDAANANLSVVTQAGVTLDAADYTITAPDALNGNKLTVTLTDTGLAKVKSGESVVLTFDVKVLEIGDDRGDIVNEAIVITNNPNTGDDITNTTNKVYTYHGKVKIHKVDANSNDGTGAKKPLSGAEFQVYKSTDATCEAGVDDVDANLLTINGQSTFVTDANGEFTIDGLHVNNVYNDNNTGTPAQSLAYCLKETKAPAGYATSNELHQFTLNVKEDRENNLPTVELQSLKLVGDSLEIGNVRQETPNLPLTGGAGVGILAAVGALIIGAGAFFARRSAKN